MTQTVVVTGATGSQGGGVVNHLMADTTKGYHVRAVTRNTSSPKAKALADRGVEIFQGDLQHKDTLVKACHGADAIFVMTDFYSVGSAEKEFEQGKNAIDAAKEAGVKFVVCSAFESFPQDVMAALPEIEPGYVVPHIQSKAKVKEYVEQSGIPYTVLLTSIFFDNFLGVMGFHKQQDGTFTFGNNLGPGPHAWHAVDDIGGTTAVILEDPEKYRGMTIPVSSGYIAQPDCEKVLSKVTGKTIRYHEVTDEQMASLPFPTAAELANMFAYYKLFPYYDQLREPSKCIYKGPSFAQWAEKNAKALTATVQD